MKKFTKQKVKDVVCVELFHSQKLNINEDSFLVDKNAQKRRKINYTNENAGSSLYNEDKILYTAKQNRNIRNNNCDDDKFFANSFMQKSNKDFYVSQGVKSINENCNERFSYGNNSKEDERVKVKNIEQAIYDKETRENKFSKSDGNGTQEGEINSMKNVQSKKNVKNLDQDICIEDMFSLCNISFLDTKVGVENKKLNAMYFLNALDFQVDITMEKKESLEGLNFSVLNSEQKYHKKLPESIDSVTCSSFVKPKNSSNLGNYSILSFNTEDLINSSLYCKKTNIKKDINVNNKNNHSNNTHNKIDSKGIIEDTKLSNLSWLTDEFNDKDESYLVKNVLIKESNITPPTEIKNLNLNGHTHNNSTIPLNKCPVYKKRKIIDDNDKVFGKHYKLEKDFNSSEVIVIENNFRDKVIFNNQKSEQLAQVILPKEDLELQENIYFENNDLFNQYLSQKKELNHEKVIKHNSNESAYFGNIMDDYEDTINKSDISLTYFTKKESEDYIKNYKE
ncbi:hypothetical protein COBT_001378 [Conglomerata obtusa]